MIHVLVADDHPLVLRGVRHVLAEAGDVAVVAEAVTGREVLEKVAAVACDAIVLDLRLPDVEGMDLLETLRERFPHVPIVVLTLHSDEHLAIRAFKAGAAGYVTKDSAAETLVDAVRAVVEGRTYVTPALADRLGSELRRGAEKLPHESLSEREHQTLRLIASGRTVSEIAAELALSVKTVSTYRTRILEKMRLRTNAELTAYAIRHRLTD